MEQPRNTPRDDDTSKAKAKATHSIKTTRASDVKQQPITWIWDKRLAQGKMTILTGDPGLGKSQIAIDIVARITRGSNWCDGGIAPLGNCIILSAEDAADDTLCPRLEVAGANQDRVEIIESVVTQNGDRSFSLAHDLGALADTVKRIGNVSLIVIDPVTAYLGDKIDSHQTTAVRAVLEPLSRFAEQQRIAILAITHPPKATQSKAMHAFTGSLAFVAAARIALVALEEPDTERKLLLGVKNNLQRMPDGLGYHRVESTTSAGIVACHVLWDDHPVDITADEALHASPDNEGKLKKAELFLKTYLKGGPAPQQEILAQGKALGLSSRTLQRAKRNLDISSDKTDYESGWTWTLPRYDEGCQNAVPPRRQPLFGRKDAK
jgi:putative DNA primase/helicase